jgi:hypothetical protein
MALTQINSDPQIVVRPGDVVFHYNGRNQQFPLHVGIYIGTEQPVSKETQGLRVIGLPGGPDEDNYLGESEWGIPGGYLLHLIGQRKDDVEPVVLKEVALISKLQLSERPQVAARCEWRSPKEVEISAAMGDGVPIFLKGTCGQFVEFVYEIAGLELLGSYFDERDPWPRKLTHDPQNPKRIYPSTQAHIFWTGRYGLRTPWDPRYGLYPDCLFGERSLI